MDSFTVTSENFALPKGSTIARDDLEGCNIDALVAGGHLAPCPDPDKAAKAAKPKE